jgi:hypothetical protein
VIVVGGTYFERCDNPLNNALGGNLIGSGLRAAAVLRSVDSKVRLATAIDETFKEDAELICGALRLSAEFTGRSAPVGFYYFTPVSSPLVDGRLSRLAEPIVVEADAVLVFGMIEAGGEKRPHASARALVLDPQQPRDLVGLDLASYKWERLAIVANAAETRALGRSSDVVEAARRFLQEVGADVVVTKRGARGVLITAPSGQSEVGPVPTRLVWPIGSGDVFAAAFAWAWAEQNLDPVTAAHVASSAASAWVQSFSLDLPSEAFISREGEELQPSDAQVYLAAPFFNLGQRWLVELTRDALRGLGATVFSPLHDVGIGETEVARKDLEGLEASSSVLALLDEADPGTVFETGWATRHGLPIVCYSEDPDPEGRKMMVGTGSELQVDLSTAIYRSVWAGMGMPLAPDHEH